jgi:hypothetical protein
MSKKKFAKSTEEFDRRFDEGEDIHDLIDMNQAKIIRHGKKVRITLDVAEELVKDIDQIYLRGLKSCFLSIALHRAMN